ncbi:MAG: hypothetical protein GWP27_06295 [Bacteroidetes bacterium]|nr:hypothetical protein [Bacteroidota bacterium]
MQWLNSENSGQDLMPNSKGFQFYISLAILLVYQGAFSQGGLKELPYLYDAPIIDGNLDEWKESAFSDGAWNIDRVKRSSWYNPKRNRLTVEENEDPEGIDLEATYYMAWDQNYIYLGAEVIDNIYDVEESKHEPKRWYYKDAIAWFMEAPADTISEKFGEGDHAFAFVLDTLRPDYGAWWRHGTSDQSYIEEPLSENACQYEIAIEKDPDGLLHYKLEARISLSWSLARNPNFRLPTPWDTCRMMIVHCDPDGGEYGGHMLIYGEGDDDNSWHRFKYGRNKVSKVGPLFPKSGSANVMDFGAINDKSGLSTEAIQAAIDLIYRIGGGTVYFPAGDYLSGTIVMKTGVSLNLDSAATLYASRNIEDYRMPLVDAIRPILIYANGASDISILGKGKIDGQAEHVYEDLKKTDGFIKEHTQNARQSGVEMKQYYTVAPDVGLLSFANCDRIQLEGVHFINSPFWAVHLVKCRQAMISGLTINSSLEKGVNSDGIDINSCQTVRIWNCNISTGDDAIAIKSWYPQTSQDIFVSDCNLTSSSTALKIGTETHGNFKNIGFKNCRITNSNRGLSIVVRDGGTVSDVSFENINIDCNRRHFNWWGNGDPIWLYVTKKNKNSSIGQIRNVTFKNIKALGMGTSRIESTEGVRIHNINLENVKLRMIAETKPDKRADHALYINNARTINLDSVQVTWDQDDVEKNWQNALHVRDVEELNISNFMARQGIQKSSHPTIHLNQVTGAQIEGLIHPNGEARVKVSGESSQNISIKGINERSIEISTEVQNRSSITTNP